MHSKHVCPEEPLLGSPPSERITEHLWSLSRYFGQLQSARGSRGLRGVGKAWSEMTV